MSSNVIIYGFLALFVFRRGFELLLNILQYSYLKKRKDVVPNHLKGKTDLETIRKASSYSRDKLKLGMLADFADAVFIWFMILWGFGTLESIVSTADKGQLVSGLMFFALLASTNEFFSLPFQIYSTFVIEQRYGFNRLTVSDFVQDKLKGLVVGAILGALLLSLVLSLMAHGGTYWWLYAFLGVSVFQLFAAWLYPSVIMPMFNKFTPVDDNLQTDAAALAASVKFPLNRVFLMDGSRRSTHANAFIVGLIGTKKIVLFDTLLDKVTRPQLLAVLAHELGHFMLKHVMKRTAIMLVITGIIFFLIAVSKDVSALYHGFGFSKSSDFAAIIIFSLIISEIAAPFAWAARLGSRRDEYAADKFAVKATGNSTDLSEALIALSKQNLSSPGSHPWYRSYYNSHPALKDRLAAIKT